MGASSSHRRTSQVAPGETLSHLRYTSRKSNQRQRAYTQQRPNCPVVCQQPLIVSPHSRVWLRCRFFCHFSSTVSCRPFTAPICNRRGHPSKKHGNNFKCRWSFTLGRIVSPTDPCLKRATTVCSRHVTRSPTGRGNNREKTRHL